MKKPSPAKVKKLCKTLFLTDPFGDSPELPVDFDTWEPILFANVFLSEFRIAQHTIAANCWSFPEVYGPIVTKLSKARPFLLGREMDELFKAIEISFDYGVLGGDTFVPTVLPNGAVLVRNHHRVISFNTKPSIILEVDSETLQKELLACQKIMKEGIEPYEGISTIHRSGEREVTWLDGLPEALSINGQSLVLIGSQFDPSTSRLLSSSGLMEACESSRIGVVAVRTFGEFSTVHASIRIDDDFDTLLEEFSDAYLDELNEPKGLNVTQDEEMLIEAFHSRALQIYDGSGMPILKIDPCRHYIELMAGARNPRGWGRKKMEQCNELLPIFSMSCNTPAMPGKLFVPFLSTIQTGYDSIYSFKVSRVYPANIKKILDNLIKAIESTRSYVSKLCNSSTVIALGHSHAIENLLLYKSTLRSPTAAKIEKALTEWLASKPQPNQESVIEVPVSVLVRRNKEPSTIKSLVSLEQAARHASKSIKNITFELLVPAVGLRQEYLDGDAQEGNIWAFLR